MAALNYDGTGEPVLFEAFPEIKEEGMTEQELRRKIGKAVLLSDGTWFKAMDITTKILALIKEVGWKQHQPSP